MRILDGARSVAIDIRNRARSKRTNELAFWKSRFEAEGGRFTNDHYDELMLGIAGEQSRDFVAGKVVADFGCGPRGSLVWAEEAAFRIGIDVLADRYADEFTKDILSHGTVDLKATERVIPLPDGLVDVMFTLNAIDHVDDFAAISAEIIRVIAPGGILAGSINLEEEPTPLEPQRVTETMVREHLLGALEVDLYRVTAKSPPYVYAPLLAGEPIPLEPGEPGICMGSRP